MRVKDLFFIIFSALYPIPHTLYPQDIPWRFSGEISANYRNIGAEPTEVEIENQLYVSDIYFSATKPIRKNFPLMLEFATDLNGQPILNQFHLNYLSVRGLRFSFGKFVVPFGRYNEIYKPSDFLSITRPLPYASPKSLDFVSRLNYAHPVTASGFSSLGLLTTYLNTGPTRAYLPSRFDLYIVNGFGENPLLGRGFPRAEVLGLPTQRGGVLIDYGHERSSLADNNDTKMVGARARFALKDLRVPFLPEGKKLRGTQIGISWLQGKYDVEDVLDHVSWGAEFVFQLGRYQINSEYLISSQDYRITPSTQTADLSAYPLPSHREFLRGFYVSNAFRLPRWFYGEETFSYVGYSLMSRRGERFEFDQLGTRNIAFIPPNNPWFKKTMEKFTFGVRSKIEENFHFKLEYSYWDLNGGDERFFSGANIYQWAASSVITF